MVSAVRVSVALVASVLFLASCGSDTPDEVSLESESDTTSLTMSPQTTLASPEPEASESIENEILGQGFDASDFGLDQACLNDAISTELGEDALDSLASDIGSGSVDADAQAQLDSARDAAFECLDTETVIESLVSLGGGEETRPFVECLVEEAGDIASLLSQVSEAENFGESVQESRCSSLETPIP